MTLAEGITRIGFRKWYERQLLQSHGHLAFCFICLVGVFAAFEAARAEPSWGARMQEGLVAAACVAAGVWALRRYLRLMHGAEWAAHQAECPACKTYGRIRLVEAARPASGDEDSVSSLKVVCKSCGQGWEMQG